MARKNAGRFGTEALERFSTSFAADYRFGPLNILLLLLICLGGLGLHLAIHAFAIDVVIDVLAVALSLAFLLRVTQVWESALLFTSVSALYLFLRHRPSSEVLVAAVILAGFVSPALQMAYQWERAVLLRFGRFRGLAGSGLFAIVPVVDKVSNYVDQRIRVTDFSAETTLTRDTVPVNVDAIAFWMVWDAEKSVLEVEDFVDAVTLSAQTGLARRDRQARAGGHALPP